MTPKGCVLDLESSNNLMIDKEWPAFLYIMNADLVFKENPLNESPSLKHFIDSSHKIFHNGG